MENTEKLIKFSNGVKVVVENTMSHVSHVGVMISAGTRDEENDEGGVMHLIEHLLFKGTKKRTCLELLDYVESVGGDINAYTSKEETCLYVSIQNQYLERAIDVLSDVFFSSEFPKEEIEKEKDVVIDEINSYKDSPQELIFDEFEEFIFGEHELSKNILGTKESVLSLNSKKIKSAFSKHYKVRNIVVSYVGGEKYEKVESLISKYFDVDICDDSVQKNRMLFQSPVRFSKIIERDSFQVHTMLGAIAPSMHDDDKTEMVLLNNLLGGMSFNSQLNLLLREEHGITYNIESNYTAYTDTGLFTIYYGTDEAKTQKAKDLIFSKCLEIIDNGFAPEQLQMYKQQLIGQIALSLDNFVSVMISNAKSYLYYDKVDSYSTVIKKINAVTNESIIELSSKILDPDSLSELKYI